MKVKELKEILDKMDGEQELDIAMADYEFEKNVLFEAIDSIEKFIDKKTRIELAEIFRDFVGMLRAIESLIIVKKQLQENLE